MDFTKKIHTRTQLYIAAVFQNQIYEPEIQIVASKAATILETFPNVIFQLAVMHCLNPFSLN